MISGGFAVKPMRACPEVLNGHWYRAILENTEKGAFAGLVPIYAPQGKLTTDATESTVDEVEKIFSPYDICRRPDPASPDKEQILFKFDSPLIRAR